MPNLLRITDPDTNDRLSITVSVAANGSEGFSQQTDATGTTQPALFFNPSVLPVGTCRNRNAKQCPGNQLDH